MKSITTRLAAVAGAWILLTFLLPSEALAVPAFARQTGMSCNQCHTSHGGATPNFTFSGKKFNALGYRLPKTPHAVQPAMEFGEPEDRGEFLRLFPTHFSVRVQHTFLANAKPPGADDWGEATTNPTSRLAFFPFVGPIGDHFGMWNEFYITPLHGNEWSIADTSFEEMDFRYVFNPQSDDVLGLALTNQGLPGIFGFTPWPTDLGSDVDTRAGVGGFSHPNLATIAAYGWMNDRWVWALGANTGDTNYGWDRANGVGLLGWAIRNRNDSEMWVNVHARAGNDAMPLLTEGATGGRWSNDLNRDGVSDDRGFTGDPFAWVYRDAVNGVSAARIGGGGAYLAEDMDSFAAGDLEFRWGGQDVGRPFSSASTGNWSYEMVARLGHATEEYDDGGETTLSRWGLTAQVGWKHTYYFKPYVNGHIDFEYDNTVTTFDIDTKPMYGTVLSYKPVENFLINLTLARTQELSLTEDAETGWRYALSTDVVF